MCRYPSSRAHRTAVTVVVPFGIALPKPKPSSGMLWPSARARTPLSTVRDFGAINNPKPPVQPFIPTSAARSRRNHQPERRAIQRAREAERTQWISNSAASSGACRSATADISGPSSRRSISPGRLGLYDCSSITLSPDELERRNAEASRLTAGFASAFPLRQTLARRLPSRPMVGALYSSARKPFEMLAMRVVVARGIPQDRLDERLSAQPRPAVGGEKLLVRDRRERRQQPRE